MKHSWLCVWLAVAACDPVTSGSGGDGGPIDAPVIDGGVVDVVLADVPLSPIDASTAICAPNPGCEAPQVVSTIGEIKDFVQGCDLWSPAEVDSFRARTRNLVTGTAMFICPNDFNLPPDCLDTNEPPCLDGMVIEVDYRLNADPTAACNGISIGAGVAFRMRMHMGLPNQGTQFRQARLTFEPPCDATCKETERRCEKNGACYDGNDLCFSCGLNDREKCACRTPDQEVLADCSECNVLYGDFISGGNCLEGHCSNQVSPLDNICSECPQADQCL